MRLQIIFTLMLILSCSGNSTGKVSLSRTGFTTANSEIIKIYSGKKLSYREHFVLASALKKKKRYLESVFHYLNSCYGKAPLENKLKSFNSTIARSLESQRGRTDIFDDAAYEIADITFKCGKYIDTVKILEQLQENKSGLYLDTILLKAEAYKKLKKYEKGLTVLKRALTLYRDIHGESFLRIRIASLHEKREEWNSSFMEYIKVVELNDRSWQARAASRRISSILMSNNIRPDTERELFLTAKALFINREYERSLSLTEKGPYRRKKEFLHLTVKNFCRTGKRKRLSGLLKQQEGKTLILELKKTAADQYWRMKKMKTSITLYREIAALNIEPYKKGSLKKIALFSSLDNRYLDSREITMFVTHYPEDPLSGKLLWLRGKSAIKKNNYQEAVQYLKKSLIVSPGGSYSENCRFWLYKIYHKHKKWGKASEILRDIVLKNPDSSYTAILLKRIIRKISIPNNKKLFTKNDTGLKKDEMLFYHSILSFKNTNSAEKMRRLNSLDLTKINNYRKVYRDIIEFNIKSAGKKRLEKLELYFRTGYKRGIKREIYRYKNENIDHGDLFIALSHFGLKYINYYYSAYYSLLTLQKRKLRIDPFVMPEKLMKIIYPAAFKDCIEKTGKKFKIEKNLLYSLIRAESFYRNNAVSQSGAVGIMQVLPSTAKEIAGKLKMKNYTLLDPCASLTFGSHYINWLKKYVGNNRTKILAAYNAGPGRVKSWKSWMKKSGDPDYRIEFIPFCETRNYVLRINKYVEHYRMIYGK